MQYLMRIHNVCTNVFISTSYLFISHSEHTFCENKHFHHLHTPSAKFCGPLLFVAFTFSSFSLDIPAVLLKQHTGNAH